LVVRRRGAQVAAACTFILAGLVWGDAHGIASGALFILGTLFALIASNEPA
jgi:hypothetical protein